MTAPQRARRDFGPVQLAAQLGLARWQLARAVAGIEAVRAAAGKIPGLGAGRAAGVLSAWFGAEVTADGVEELARRGLITVTGSFKGYPLYDGRALTALTDAGAVIEATRAGRLRTADQAAAYLKIRRSDLAHLTRPGILKPVRYGRSSWDRRGQASVPLYRTGDLDALDARPDIDWAAVCATPPRHRSPLAALERAENILAALAGQAAAGRRRSR